MVTIFSVFAADRHEVTIDKRRCGDHHFPPVASHLTTAQE